MVDGDGGMAVMSDVGPRLIGKYFTPSMRDNGHLVALEKIS